MNPVTMVVTYPEQKRFDGSYGRWHEATRREINDIISICNEETISFGIVRARPGKTRLEEDAHLQISLETYRHLVAFFTKLEKVPVQERENWIIARANQISIKISVVVNRSWGNTLYVKEAPDDFWIKLTGEDLAQGGKQNESCG